MEVFNHIVSDFIQNLTIASGRNIQQAGARPAEWSLDHILIIRLSEASAYGCFISVGSDCASKLATLMIPKIQAEAGNNIKQSRCPLAVVW